ncbi:Aste57867_11837 [Aphanomyces stellatus]|uniref:Aste57867_11837 protein n=1 Tax=Aphanomyces stellatus TaxID=120398 RepID=A0A485KU18_9STRA|nr:hypothetical protein As57867_011792 [Aphanomyces stellatus]VFT88692.1 Aste57867_11837 [Aphanomyces stellatus]
MQSLSGHMHPDFGTPAAPNDIPARDMVDLLGWPLGLSLSFIASIVGVLGKVMLKLSFRPGPLLSVQSAESKCWWGTGMLLIVVVNPVLCIAALKFAPQSLLSPMGGMCVVWNTVFSPTILHEILRPRDILGAAIIFVGCIVVGVVGSHETHDIPLDQLASHFTSAPFLVYLSLFVLLLVFLTRQAVPAMLMAWDGDDPTNSYTSVWCRASLASLAGSISGQMFCLCALLRLTKNHAQDVLTSPLVYVVAAAALAIALTGLYLLNMALKLYDALFVIYIYEATLLVGGAISGICFFGDMQSLELWHWIVYGVGVALIVVGICVISHGERHRGGGGPVYIDDLHAVKQTLL